MTGGTWLAAQLAVVLLAFSAALFTTFKDASYDALPAANLPEDSSEEDSCIELLSKLSTDLLFGIDFLWELGIGAVRQVPSIVLLCALRMLPVPRLLYPAHQLRVLPVPHLAFATWCMSSPHAVVCTCHYGCASCRWAAGGREDFLSCLPYTWQVGAEDFLSCLHHHKRSEGAVLILYLYFALAVILLVNMLIAIMSKTFDSMWEAQAYNYLHLFARTTLEW
jgi:hypothetical protein